MKVMVGACGSWGKRTRSASCESVVPGIEEAPVAVESRLRWPLYAVEWFPQTLNSASQFVAPRSVVPHQHLILGERGAEMNAN